MSAVPELKAGSLSIKNVRIGTITPYEGNPKKHSPEAVRKLADMIAEFGWTQPIVIDKERVIIIGHRRYAAAQMLGYKLVPVVVADLDPTKARALRLMDNRLADDTPVDELLVKAELSALQAMDFNMDLTGFTAEELHLLVPVSQSKWLDKDVQGTDDAPAGHERTPSDLNTYVQVTFVVTPDQRDMIVKRLKKYAADSKLPTAGAALIKLCEGLPG